MRLAAEVHMATSRPGEIAARDAAADAYARRAPFSRRFEAALPYLLLAPSLLLLVVLFAWPMVQALLLSVQDADGGFTLQYLQRMVRDVNFWPALRSTVLLIVIAVPLQFVLAIIMGLLMQARLRGASFFLYLWTIPLAISDLAAGLVWLAIFSDRGFLNSVLQGLGLLAAPFAFLSYEQPIVLLLCVVVAEVWRATSIVMVIVVAGLQLIPPDYLEAAEVFGANTWQRVWRVMLPMIRSSLQVALILRTILAFQVFAVVIALAGRAMTVLAAEAFTWYQNRNANVAAAYALLILVFSLITTAIYLRALRTSEEELRR
jgi:multiple sugar transport system permease protein